MKKTLLTALGLAMFSGATYAQRIENTAVYRQINSDSYFKIHFENDFFTHTDWYYSQGLALELVNPALEKNPLNKVLLKLDRKASDNKKFGLALEINAFTPTDIVNTPPFDRPYAATMMLKSFAISNNFETKSRLSTSLVLGVIGPAAFGKEIQTWIHRWTDNYLPKGWPQQVRNDVVLNYNVNHEQRIFDLGNFLALNTNAQLRLGTLSDKVQAGFTLMAGKFISPFETNPEEKHFQLYAYTQPLVSLVGYDATLQGGLFNRNSPYTISDSDVTRVTFENQTGVILQIHRFQAEAFVSLLTKEFNVGRMHRWGGLRLGFEL